jgi:hypothetical protein
MAGAINLTETDFQQIKNNLISYLKSTEKFTDYDFDGSNLNVILSLIAYQSQLNSYSTNMVANESFLTSASIRENVVRAARQVGYTPSSSSSAQSTVTFSIDLKDGVSIDSTYPQGLPAYLQIRPGQYISAYSSERSYSFTVADTQSAAVRNDGVCVFEDIIIYEGTSVSNKFVKDSTNYTQRFILENEKIDSNSIRVEVQEDPNEDLNQFYRRANNITELDSEGRYFWIEEVNQEFIELTFGDGYFGKALDDGAIIKVSYIVTNGSEANGIQGINNFKLSGVLYDYYGGVVRVDPTFLSATPTDNGSELEDPSEIRFRAPKSYASQNRCVTTADYESVIRKVYPSIEDMYVFGGETLENPEFGRVYVVIKPKTGERLSGITKEYIKNSLEDYRIASLDIKFQDPEVIYVEADSQIYYDNKKTDKDSATIVAEVKQSLIEYNNSNVISRFGGAVRFSRIVGIIDDSDYSITRNRTKLRLKKRIQANINSRASYEICFDNQADYNKNESVITSTGFQLSGDDRVYYFEDAARVNDDSNGIIQLYFYDETNAKVVINNEFGTIDYNTGEIKLGYVNPFTIMSTVEPDNTIEVRMDPINNGQDIVANSSVFLDFDIGSSKFAAIIDRDITGS